MNNQEIKPVSVKTFQKLKNNNEKITMLTAYDYSTAKYIDESGIDAVLIGDSLGMTILGYDNTINVTIEDMITFTKAVSRGIKRALVVADMPFLSYHLSKEQATLNAGKLIQSGAKAVKLEGASDFILDNYICLEYLFVKYLNSKNISTTKIKYIYRKDFSIARKDEESIINQKFSTRKFKDRLDFNIQQIKQYFKPILSWISEIFSLIYYLLKIVFKIFERLRKCI